MVHCPFINCELRRLLGWNTLHQSLCHLLRPVFFKKLIPSPTCGHWEWFFTKCSSSACHTVTPRRTRQVPGTKQTRWTGWSGKFRPIQGKAYGSLRNMTDDGVSFRTTPSLLAAFESRHLPRAFLILLEGLLSVNPSVRPTSERIVSAMREGRVRVRSLG